MLATLLAPALLTAAPAWAGDKGACRKARRQMTVEAWTKYVLDHPEGRCADEAIGQLFVLNIGRFATSATKGDRTKLALSLAQLGRTDMDELGQLTSLLGGGGFGGLGGMGGGGGIDSLFGSYDDYGGDYGVLGSLSGGGLGYGADYDPTIYVSYYVDQVDGAWNDDQFWTVLDGTRPKLQSCYQDLGRDPMGIYYLVGFDVKDGVATVTSVKQDYSDDGAQHADVEACVRDSVSSASFPTTVSGSYSYRVELY